MRMGTTAPMVRHVGDALSLCSPHEAYVLALSRVLGEAPEPEDVAVVVPTWWSQLAQERVTATLAAQYPGAAVRLASAAPAALRAFGSTRSMTDSVVAVLDVGATCTSATVVAENGAGQMRVEGSARVLHGRGGDCLDALLMQHVLGIVAGEVVVDRSNADVLDAARELRNEVRDAKEQFSTHSVVRLVPKLPGFESELRLVRAEFDDVVRPVISEIVAMLAACVAASGAEVSAVLLIGGGAPTPLLTQMISVELGLPALLDDEPASTAARGAMGLNLVRAGRRDRLLGGILRGQRTAPRAAGGVRLRPPAPRAPAALIVAIPPRAPVDGVDAEAIAPSPTDDAVTDPSAVPEAVSDQVPQVGQLPHSVGGPQPRVSRHAAPPSGRGRPEGQKGTVGSRARRGSRRKTPEAAESQAVEPESANVESTPPAGPAPQGAPR